MGWLSRLLSLGASEQETKRSTARRPSGPFVQWRDDSYPMEAVGESHYQEALENICGGHSRYGHEFECIAILAPEPENRFDSNAVKVSIKGKTVGYLSRQQAGRVSSAMRELNLLQAGCRAKINGGWRTNQYDSGYFGVRLSIPNRGAIDFGSGGVSRDTTPNQPKKTTPVRPEPSEAGPLTGHRVALMGPRNGELANKLAEAGARIMAGVGKTTTLLVVAGQSKPFDIGTRGSASFRKATELAENGSPIQILSESEALELID